MNRRGFIGWVLTALSPILLPLTSRSEKLRRLLYPLPAKSPPIAPFAEKEEIVQEHAFNDPVLGQKIPFVDKMHLVEDRFPQQPHFGRSPAGKHKTQKYIEKQMNDFFGVKDDESD